MTSHLPLYLLAGALMGACAFGCAPAPAQTTNAPLTGQAGDELKVGAQDQNYSTQAVLPATLQVQESKISHTLDPRLFGLSYSWTAQTALQADSLEVAPDFLRLAKGIPFPFNRIGGAEGQDFKWKQAIGPLDQRPTQEIKWAGKIVMRNGPVEWMNSIKAVDPKAKFAICINLKSDTVQDNADFAEFLLGDGKTNPNGGENWAQKRIECGQAAPLPVEIWEIGNELDWDKETSWTPLQYADRCRQSIAAIRAIDPSARFAVHAATSPTSDKPRPFANREGGWVDWHRLMLRELGPQIDFIVVHPYYVNQTINAEKAIDLVKRDIKEITGNDRIGIFLSEHGYWFKGASATNNQDWWRTHSLRGTLGYAQMLNKMIEQPNVIGAAWSFSGGPWRAFGRDDKTKELYKTGLAELLRVLNQNVSGQVVASQLSGERTALSEPDYSFSASALKSADGLTLVLVNREPTAQRALTLGFEGKYRLAEEVRLTGDSLDSHNAAGQNGIEVASRKVTDGAALSTYSVAAKSLVVLKLQPLAPA